MRASVILLCLFGFGPALAQDVSITLEPGGAAPIDWTVRYEADRPVMSLHFTRVPGDSRAPRWTSLDPDIELVHTPRDGTIGPSDTIRRKDGAPFRVAAFSTPAIYAELPKDYAPFARFTDGGLLIHSGRFHVCANLARCHGAWRMTVKPDENAGVLALARWRRGAATFTSTGSGTFVYVGERRPVEGERYWSLIDPGFPAQAHAALDALFPSLTAHYAREFGELERKPMLFASVDLSEVDERTHSQGGTLPEQVMMHMQGPAWGAPDRDFAWLPWFYAHEAAHLYQKRLNIQATDSWVHEGAAEALAHAALDRLGTAPPSYLAAKRRTAFHRCARFLARHPLKDAAHVGAFQRYYDCGLHMWFAASAALERSGAGDLHALWRAIEERARKLPNGAFDVEVVYETVAELGDTGTADFLRAMVERAHPDDSAVFLRKGLIAAGVDHADVNGAEANR